MTTSNRQTREYIYSGPPSGVTLDSGEEILFWPDKSYSLPQDHPYVVGLKDQGYLKEVKAKTKPETKAPKASKKSSKKEGSK